MINIKINGTEYTLEEAQKLYNELRQIFEEHETHVHYTIPGFKNTEKMFDELGIKIS